MNLGDTVRVIWIDSHSVSGWIAQYEIDRSIASACMTIVSAGLFVAQTETGLILTRGISENGMYHGTLEIPNVAIKEIKILEESQLNAR